MPPFSTPAARRRRSALSLALLVAAAAVASRGMPDAQAWSPGWLLEAMPASSRAWFMLPAGLLSLLFISRRRSE